MDTTEERQPSVPADSDATTDVTALQSELDDLRHDVERTDRHLQGVIDQYESILTEVRWEYEHRLSELETQQDACQCAVHRLARWLPGPPT
jgi:hypothetical protein